MWYLLSGNIHWINRYLLVTLAMFGVVYPFNSDLSTRKHFFYASRGIYNLNKTSENTRDWALMVSRFLTSDLEQYDQEGRGGIFFHFFGRLFLGFSYSSFLASVLLWKSSKNTLHETLTHHIKSKQSNFRIKLKTLFNQIRTANLMLLTCLYYSVVSLMTNSRSYDHRACF